MQLILVVVLALISNAAADVSHLNLEYLPPAQPGAGVSVSDIRDGDAVVGPNVGSSYIAPHTSHQQSLQYALQSQEVPVYGGNPIDNASEETLTAEPATTANIGVTTTHGTYGNNEAKLQYQVAVQKQQQFAVPAPTSEVAENEAEAVDFLYGGSSYDLSSQDAGVQDLGHNSLLSDSYGNALANNEVQVNGAAIGGTAIRTPQSAISTAVAHDAVAQYVSGVVSGSSGIDTQYGANGGYIY